MAKRSLLITGVPGSGKSTVACALAKKTGAALIGINEVAASFGLYSGQDSDGSRIVKLGELERKLRSLLRKERGSAILEGHLGCEIRLPVQKVVVLRCEPKILRQRLAERDYPQEKISQNALSEALDYCTVLSEKNYGKRKVWEIDTTGKGVAEVVAEAERIFLGKARKKKPVSFPDALMREALTGEKIRKIKIA
ncbi:MAG: AAA family ATPase [Candidatus Micrarchaeota archaeon]|nr:AAA family ATPase [Candidatus Micrarchaeota archaeon]